MVVAAGLSSSYVVLVLILVHERRRYTQREAELEEARKGAARGARRKIDAQKAGVQKQHADLYQRAIARIKHITEMHKTEMVQLEAQYATQLDELKRAEQDAWRRLDIEQKRATRDVKNAKTSMILTGQSVLQ